MTTVGVLAPARDREIIDGLAWADIRFGVDDVSDVVRRVTDDVLDVLVVDASVAFLTTELVALHPARIGCIVAIAKSDSTEAWARTLEGVHVVRSIAEVKSTFAPEAAQSPSASKLTMVASRQRESTVIAVWGPVGAPGVTTAAISLATVAAAAGASVLLCDADTRGSAIAIALALADETPGLAAACRLVGRGEFSDEELVRLASPYSRDSWRFDVLTGIPRASRWVTIEPAKLRAVLAVARDRYEVIIVDVGFGIEENEWVDDAPQRDGAARELLRTADHVVAVGRSDAVGVARLIRALDDASDLRSDPVVVFNASAPNSTRDAIDAMRRFTAHAVRVAIPRDSRGGVEDAVPRALGASSPWRTLADSIGIPSSPAKRRRFARR